MTVLLTIIISFAVMLAVIAAMSIGVMYGRKPISGSCGGVAGRGCELCGGGECRRSTDDNAEEGRR